MVKKRSSSGVPCHPAINRDAVELKATTECHVRDLFAPDQSSQGFRRPTDIRSALLQVHVAVVSGGDIYVLSKMLGHSSVQVTQRHYAFIAPDDVGAKVLAVMEPTKPAKATKRKR